MAKLDQKFSKGSKSKHRFDYEEDLREFNQHSRKKKRRFSRQREEYLEYNDDSY